MTYSGFRWLYDKVFPPVTVSLDKHTAETYLKLYGERVLKQKFYRNFGVTTRIDEIDGEFVLVTDNIFPVPLLVFGAILFLAAISALKFPATAALLLVLLPMTYVSYRVLQLLESKHAHRNLLHRTRGR